LRQQLASQGIINEDTQLEVLRMLLKDFLYDYEDDFHSENTLESMEPPQEPFMSLSLLILKIHALLMPLFLIFL